MIRVLIVDDAPATLHNIEHALSSAEDTEPCGTALDGQSAVNMANDLHPDVVLVGIDVQGGGLDATKTIVRDSPSTAVIVMGIDDDDATLQTVADSGAAEYMVKPFGGDELVATIRQVHQVHTEAAQPQAAQPEAPMATPLAEPLFAPTQVADIPTPDPITEVTAQPQVPAATPEPERLQLIAFNAGKGGVGTTVLATNFALIASSEIGLKTALVDFDLQHGDVRRLLRVDSSQSLIELASSAPTADPHDLSASMAVGPGGLFALLAPPRPRLDSELTPQYSSLLTTQLRSTVDVAVIDVPSHLTESGVVALRAADRIVLVSSMSDPGVRATQGTLSLYGELGIDHEKIVLVLNRNEANSDLTKAVVEEALGLPVAIQLPYDFVLVSNAINRGAPFVLQRPDAHVSRKVRELASMVFGVPIEIEEPSEDEPRPIQTTPDSSDEDQPRKRSKRKGIFSFGKE